MLLLILAIFVAIMVWAIIVACRTKEGDTSSAFTVLAIIAGVCALIVGIICCVELSEIRTEVVVDRKIEMYQNENAKIEAQIDTIVQNYFGYEGELFKDTGSTESPMLLISLYPELKSDSLVQKEMEVYAKNNAMIKELREQKIGIGKTKWELYFGR